MILLGHVGLTTGAFKVFEKTTLYKNKIRNTENIDYRIVIIGSLMPDIIDKPLGAFLLRDYFHNSRIFTHTLFVSALILVSGVWFYYRKKTTKILFLGLASLIHLILDSMWLYPAILFWPFLGWKFPQRAEGHWLSEDLIRLVSDPFVWAPELFGGIIIGYLIIKALKNNNFRSFLKKGKL